MSDWHEEMITPDLMQAERVIQVLFDQTTSFQRATIIHGAYFGRSLILDGKTQSTEKDEFIYHEALVHPAMTSHPNPRNIFIAGGGEGATAREILKHDTVENVVMLDIDREVVNACKEFLPTHHKGSFYDNRLKLIFDDAFEYLSQNEQKYDVAIIDVPDPLESGPAHKIFTLEFYRLLMSRLTINGLMVCQSGPAGPMASTECFSAVVNTVSKVFSLCIPYQVFVPAFTTTWGFTIGMRNPKFQLRTACEVEEILRKRNIDDLQMYDGEAHQHLYSLPLYLRNSIKEETRVISEESPLFVF